MLRRSTLTMRALVCVLGLGVLYLIFRGSLARAFDAAVIWTATRDLSRGLGVPSRIETLANRGGLMYSAHAGLGDVLSRLGVPNGAAVEWMKAAAHAGAEAEVAQAARGLREARARGGDDPATAAALCRMVRTKEGAVAAVAARAGLSCP